jgi:hypothetical protein
MDCHDDDRHLTAACHQIQNWRINTGIVRAWISSGDGNIADRYSLGPDVPAWLRVWPGCPLTGCTKPDAAFFLALMGEKLC